MDASNLLDGIRLVPVVKLEDPRTAVPLARTLYDSGIRAMEITLRTATALEAIAAVAAEVPEMLVGAGSVRRADQVDEVQNAGARFAVSPGSSDALLKAVHRTGLPFVPGAVTATEMMTLTERGYQLLKFFPAELSGGTAKLKALSQPLPELRFFPTGGIDLTRAAEYLALPQVACIGGSWFVPDDSLAAHDFTHIAALAAAAMAVTHG